MAGQPMTVAARTQILAPAVVVVLNLLLILTVANLVVGWAPYSLDEAPWRFRSISELLNAGPQITFLIMMIALTAVHDGEYQVVRTTAIIAFVVAGALIAVQPFFAKDFLAMRYQQHSDALDRFTRDSIRLGAQSVVLAVGLVLAGRRALFAAELEKVVRTQRGHGLIVAQEKPQA